MQSRTVAISLLVHGALAATLFGAATRRAAHRPIAVALSEARKKEKAKDKPVPPPAPRPIARAPVARKVADLPRPEAAPAPSLRAAPAALATALTMSNDGADEGPGGIALPSRQAAERTPAATKVASAVTDSRRRRVQEALGAGPGADAPCTEEPTRPEPVFKQEIEYTAQARAEGVEGKLKLRLTVATDGSVSKVDVVEGVSPELDGAAVGAARLWRFKPAVACGKPVVGTYVLARRFELGD